VFDLMSTDTRTCGNRVHLAAYRSRQSPASLPAAGAASRGLPAGASKPCKGNDLRSM